MLSDAHDLARAAVPLRSGRATMGMPELPSKVKLVIACSGIFFSFSYFAVLQEDV